MAKIRTYLILSMGMLLAACSGSQVLNILTPSQGYRLTKDIVFDTTTNLKLDIYTPEGAKNAPAVVFFYGGRWQDGSKDQYVFVGQALAASGFVAVLADYRLYPDVKFPAFLQDTAQTLRWTHENIADYGGAPDKIVVMGHSAGAYNAAMLALDPQLMQSVGGSRDWIKGMVGLAGPYDFLPLKDADLRDIFAAANPLEISQPIAVVDGNNPPLFLLHGQDDQSVKVKNTINLSAKVRQAGGSVETLIYPEMSHVWIVATLAAPLRSQSDVLQRVSEFIRRVTEPATAQALPPKSG